MNPNGHRLPAPVASLRKHRPRWNAATITALRPQVLPYIAARVLEPEQSPCQRACCGTAEEAAPRLLPRGHRAEYRLSVGHLRQALKQPGPPRHLGAARAMRQELPTVVPQDLPDDNNPVLLRAPGVCLRSDKHRGPARTREEGTGRAKEVGHLGGERRPDSRSRERERRGRQGHCSAPCEH